jgi:hypothetical protein
MTWSDFVDDTIRVAQQKTAAKLAIPIHGALQRELAVTNHNHETILATAYGKRFSLKGFGNMISNAIKEAGLPKRCKAHGLRKAAARRLAEAGCSASEIAAITGHKTLAEVERYTRAADQERLARQAMQRQSANRSGKPPADEVANATDEALEINSLMWKMALPRDSNPCFRRERAIFGFRPHSTTIEDRHFPGPARDLTDESSQPPIQSRQYDSNPMRPLQKSALATLSFPGYLKAEESQFTEVLSWIALGHTTSTVDGGGGTRPSGDASRLLLKGWLDVMD